MMFDDQIPLLYDGRHIWHQFSLIFNAIQRDNFPQKKIFFSLIIKASNVIKFFIPVSKNDWSLDLSTWKKQWIFNPKAKHQKL